MNDLHAESLLGLALLLAWAWDALFGEPSDAWHPVARLGQAMQPIGERLAGRPAAPAVAGGTMAWLLIAALLGTLAWGWQRMALAAPDWVAAPLLALALKPSFAWRMLHDEVAAVETALGIGLEEGRNRVARLVSRDVSAFDAAEVRETAIETLAENLNDSLVAPLFWFAVAGLPGAVVYRFANTADAMWGYRGRWEWAGKFAARADDVLSWLPARLTALLLLAPGLANWQALRGEAAKTPSPNGGWPMGAMALRLGVRLGKPGLYLLNPGAPAPGAGHLVRALRCATQAAWCAVALAVASWMARAL